MADNPSCDEYWGLGFADFNAHNSGDAHRDYAQEDILYTGSDSRVVDGVMSPLSPDEEHLFAPRDNFEGNPYFDVDDEGKPTANALYVYTVEELALTPEEAEAARPFHVARETRKPPWYAKGSNPNSGRDFCPMWEPAPLAHSLKPLGERRRDMWSFFNKLEWLADKGKKVTDPNTNKVTFVKREPNRGGWLYIGMVVVSVPIEVTLPDKRVLKIDERIRFFINRRRDEFSADIERYPTVVNKELANMVGDGAVTWLERLRKRGWDFSKGRTLTRPEYEAKLKELKANRAKAQQTVIVGTTRPPEAICDAVKKDGKVCNRVKPCRYHS
jgi:hypothetical protein